MTVEGDGMQFGGRYWPVRQIVSLFMQHPLTAVHQALREGRSSPTNCNGSEAPGPQSIYFELTDACNLRCKSCWLWGEEGILLQDTVLARNMKETMKTGDIFRLLDQLAPSRPIITYSGGDPCIRKDLVEIIQYTHDLGMYCSINSNGTLITPELAEQLVRAGLSSAVISVDGLQETSDENRGEGTFAGALEGLAYLRKARGHSGVPVLSVICTITKFNQQELAQMLDLAEEHQIDNLRIQHQWFTTESQIERHKQTFCEATGENSDYLRGFVVSTADTIDPAVLVEQMDQLRQRNSKVNVQFYPDMDGKETVNYYNDITYMPRDTCVAPWKAVNIRPNGDLSTCPAINYVAGNIRDHSFEEVWNSPRQKTLRSYLLKNGLMPGCSRCCGLFCK